jgi:hypothetical protein
MQRTEAGAVHVARGWLGVYWLHIVEAARLIALRIRQYVPQRQTFMIWSMSESDGFRFDLSSAAARRCWQQR